jgi:putative transcriptional regulator
MIRLELAPMLEKRGRSFYWLTKAAQINPSVMTRMKQHTIKAVTLGVLDRICTVLECAPGDVLIKASEKRMKSKKAKRG